MYDAYHEINILTNNKNMASNYTGRMCPAEVMIYKDNTDKLIRKRETFEYLEKNMIWN